ncbi:ATP-dependent DNA helicase RecG [Candidatus Uhrbacteria bacterium]|nr:ATP-dependent DNA helicase RecG [Candidatus Uhrbacteria bacterium]
MEVTSAQPIAEFHRIAKALARPLARLGIATVGDLLRYFPVRHEDLQTVTTIAALTEGQRSVIRGRVLTIANRRTARRHLMVTEAMITDASGAIRCVWFQQPYLAHAFAVGMEVLVAGVPEMANHGMQISHPLIERDVSGALHAGRIVPIYPLTAGISQKQVRLLVHAALPAVREFVDPLPRELRAAEGLLEYAAAVRAMHFPPHWEVLRDARERLACEEALVYCLRVRASREERTQARAPYIAIDPAVTAACRAALPFVLTNAQERVLGEVLQDCAGGTDAMHSAPTEGVRPMQRLVNGDVGSGKTVIAAIAMAQVARAGLQSAYLAPTEILATQQAATMLRWLQPLGIRVALWTRTTRWIDGQSVPPRTIARELASGDVGVIVGTHAILAERVTFARLALAVIDEQHRFGVEQRATLRAKATGGMPHLLSMTATPIPRTLTLTLLGDLDVSLLDERPPHRVPVRTVVIAPADRAQMSVEVRAELALGHQVYIVCPSIAQGEESDTAAVVEAVDRARRAFPEATVDVLHGKMSATEKRSVMQSFADCVVQVLVATTVVEVGVDQPNATVIIIEDAERFGLAQLHQLRGRVGRGSAASMCYLTTRHRNPEVRARLDRIAACADGFTVAEFDLEERGPGAVVGTTQSGWPAFRFAAIGAATFACAQRIARELPHTVCAQYRAAHLE